MLFFVIMIEIVLLSLIYVFLFVINGDNNGYYYYDELLFIIYFEFVDVDFEFLEMKDLFSEISEFEDDE